MKALIFLLLTLTLSRAAEPGIVFDIQTNRLESGIPREAHLQEEFNLQKHGTLAKVLGDTLQTVTICHFNTNVWTEQKQVGEYLTGLLVDQQTETWTFQIWSQGVGEPDIKCLLTFKNHRQGKLLVWGTTACVRDDTGKWWFVSVFDYYHRKDPRGDKSLAHKTPKREMNSTPNTALEPAATAPCVWT